MDVDIQIYVSNKVRSICLILSAIKQSISSAVCDLAPHGGSVNNGIVCLLNRARQGRQNFNVATFADKIINLLMMLTVE